MDDERLLPAGLRDRPSFVLIRLAALMRQECAALVAAAGLRQHEHAILCCLEEFGPAVQKDVAARLGIDPGDTVAFLDGLEGGELIVRERDPRDRRRQVLTITRRGRTKLRRIERALDEAEPGLLAALDPGGRAALLEAARAVLADHDPAAWERSAHEAVAPGGAR